MAEGLNLGSHSMVVGYQEPLRLDPLDFPANSCASCARKWVQLRQTIALALWQGLDRRLRLAFEMKKKRLALGKGSLFFGNLRGEKHPKTYRCHPWWCNISPWIFWPPLAAEYFRSMMGNLHQSGIHETIKPSNCKGCIQSKGDWGVSMLLNWLPLQKPLRTPK